MASEIGKASGGADDGVPWLAGRGSGAEAGGRVGRCLPSSNAEGERGRVVA